MIELSMFIF